MKRRLIVVALLISALLCSCAQEDAPAPTPSFSSPPYRSSYFSSYRELASSIIPEEELGKTWPDNISVKFPDSYKQALSRMIADGIPVPCKGGIPVQLYEQEGYWPITLFANHTYSGPALLYRTADDSKPFLIEISLEQDKSYVFTDEDPGSEIVRALAPRYPNLHNAEKRTDDYSYIGERIITTSNGDKNALYKTGTDNREYFTFMQNGFVVELFAIPDILTDEWFKDFSIESMPVFDVNAVETGMSRDQVHQILGTPDREVGNLGMIDQYDIYNDDALTLGYHLDHEGTPRVAYSFAGTDPYDRLEEKGMYKGMSRSAFNTILPESARFDFAEYSIWWAEEDWMILASFNGDTVSGFDAILFEALSRSPETFAEIEKGMSMFEVVSRIGAPDQRDLDCTIFHTIDGPTYEIYWIYDEDIWVVSDIVAPESE